jgi:hypothetical protein
MTCIDHDHIDLKVTLKSGVSYPRLKCYLLRTYSVPFKGLDAEALILFCEINGMRVNGARIEPSDYLSFSDSTGKVWNIVNIEQNSPPDAPALIFGLKN